MLGVRDNRQFQQGDDVLDLRKDRNFRYSPPLLE